MAKQLTPHEQQIISTAVHDPEAMLGSLAVRAMCGGKGVSTFHRWRHDPDEDKRFPDPDIWIGNSPYWRRKTVVGWLDRQASHRDARRQVVLANAAKAQAAREA